MNFFKTIDETSLDTNNKIVSKFREKMVTKLLKDEKKHKNKIRDDYWRVGVICKQEIYELTVEILKILDTNGYEWKLLDTTYSFKIRKKKENRPKADTKSNTKMIPLNIGLKIFSGVDSAILDEYLLDLRKFCGPIMEFMEFSRELISSLQKAGLVLYKIE